MIKVYKIQSKLLNQKRNISIYVPDNKKGPYKVLYMHDGQNLFFNETSSYGEVWDVHTQYDRFLKAGLIEPHIIVGIDNTKYRMDEYCPFDNSNIYKEFSDDNRVPYYGDIYARFIVEELKPWVDKKFPTKPDKENTLISGSSLGGLISLYMGLVYPNVFGSVGVFSTSAWWNVEGLANLLNKYNPSIDQRYFITCGSNESGSHKTKANKAYTNISNMIYKSLENKVNHIFYKIYEGGIHNEAFWASQMSEFIQFTNQK